MTSINQTICINDNMIQHFPPQKKCRTYILLVIFSSKVCQFFVEALSIFQRRFVNFSSNACQCCIEGLNNVSFPSRHKISDIQSSRHFFFEGLSIFRRRFVTFSLKLCHFFHRNFVTLSLIFSQTIDKSMTN